MELDTYGTARDVQELLAVRDSIDELLARRPPQGGDAVGPRAELRDLGEAFRLVFEVPGVAHEDIEVGVQGRRLVVAGHREGYGSGEQVFSERPAGPFQRTVTLPSEVDPEQATAQLAYGLLILHLPKR